jgi:hypothetical protein
MYVLQDEGKQDAGTGMKMIRAGLGTKHQDRSTANFISSHFATSCNKN